MGQPEPKLQLEDRRWHQVQLVHADTGSRVVLVQIRQGDVIVDAALGEASTAEEAEDRARQRLQARSVPPARPMPPAPSDGAPPAAPRRPSRVTPPALGQPGAQAGGEPSPDHSPDHSPEPGPELPGESAPQAAPQMAEEPPADPEDWSSELARLDLQLQRLGWDRDQEAIYLQRVFAHPNRNRLTNYGDLLAYLQALEGFAPGTDPATAPAPLRRRELLSQCDTLLGQLGWDPGQGRAFLEQHFSLSSRQQLSDTQLLQFNMLLEEEFIKTLSNPLEPSRSLSNPDHN